jgi:hypothetical protein
MLGSKLQLATLACLVATICAFTSKCVPSQYTPTDGLCKGMTFSRKLCTSESIETQGLSWGEYLQKSLSTIDQSTCLDPEREGPEYFLLQGGADQSCARIGGTVNPGFCTQGGGRCKVRLSGGACKSDAECVPNADDRTPANSRMQCCSSVFDEAMLICSNVNTTLLNNAISYLKTQPVEQRGCRDSDCWSSGSSATSSAVFASRPHSVPSLVTIAGLLAIAVSMLSCP